MLAPEAEPRTATDRSAPRLYCLLLCDLADSTALIERLGDTRAADLLRQHDRVARDTLKRHHGREIDKTDGFLILFERPIDAVAFALDYQTELARIGEASGLRLRSRVGIHVGEILSWRNAEADIAGGAKPVEVEGLAKAIAARLMALADPGQILLSESAYSLALRARNELSVEPAVKWKAHGYYRLQGVAAALPVFEVGAELAPLAAPRDKIKARRVLPWYRWKPVLLPLLLALVVAPLWYALKPAPAIAFVERDWIVVGDLRNLTGDAQFDLALDRAIRAGLEQSRYVNVISLPRQRQVMQQMGVEEGVLVDRTVGSELAQRVGARAVMLATLSQRAGRLRFTAELVDPISEATVYAESAELDSLEGVLPAVDSALRAVRSDLGESLTRIDESTIPLADAVTPSLDALRAYSVGLRNESEQLPEEARQAFELALSLDSGFAAAEAGLGRYWYWRGDAAKALAAYQRALAHPTRLTERQRLSYEATTLSIRGDPAHIIRWEAILAVYPDQHTAAHNLAQFHLDDNRFAESLRYAEAANTPQSPTAVASGYVGAMAALGLGDRERAKALFQASRLAGGELPVRICAAVAAGTDDVAAAFACLRALPEQASVAQRADALWFLAVLARESGDHAAALRHLDELDSLLPQLNGTKGAALRVAAVGMRLRSDTGGQSAREALAELVRQAEARLDDRGGADRRGLEIVTAALAFHALQHRQQDLYERLQRRRPSEPASRYAHALWLAVATAAGGNERRDDVMAALREQQGPEAPLLVDVLMLTLLSEAGRHAEAQAARQALRERRSRAFAEFGESYLLLDEYLVAMRNPTPAGGASPSP